MQKFIIEKNEEGMRLDKFIERILPLSGKAFNYKMLRKKNIVLNDKKAEGNERVAIGDSVTFYLSDETFEKFGGKKREVEGERISAELKRKGGFDFASAIIYEDEDVLLVNKPVGILTQKAKPEDVSLNEYLLDYLLETGKVSEHELTTFRPSVCNRLDRNTSGIVCCGVSIRGLRGLSEIFRERKVHKYYMAICSGRVQPMNRSRAYLVKDEKNNKVTVFEDESKAKGLNCEVIETAWRPLKYDEKTGCSLAEVELFTGKSHQIRAHMAMKGYPIVGDAKYLDTAEFRRMRNEYRIKSQLLTAYRIVFTKDCPLEAIAGREFKIKLPAGFFISV